ncbi:MAG: RNA methyltransferase [Rhodobacteraceae bacterium CG17_big_fil_post_rev_8_21_14_2_50_63_15]|nr:class I SAM-dependent RNA methyltransferase [Roseovarius sp.]PIV77694.1 MAG: RNA methyltransferase [Rhodobacteraceae bacterium CG17_big_fil_post_rev_8_21_14_2_50_63_15]
MMRSEPFEIFLAAPPGLESVLAEEAREQGFGPATVLPGGVSFMGRWPEVWRANLVLRGAGRVLARIGAFRAFHLAQLDKRAHKFDWAAHLRPDVPLRIDVTCRKSKIYHAGAATERIARAITETLGAPVTDEAKLRLMARIEDDLVTFSLDTSGEPLHRRGYKEAVGKAPLRETLAALFLRQCGYDGQMPVLDPMCGSGSFVIEAAERAAGLHPGRARRFAFEDLAGFDERAWQTLRHGPPRCATPLRFLGFDRDAGAVRGAAANAARAGVDALTQFTVAPISALGRPDGPSGLVMVNPPYGTRIGERKLLFGLYGALGEVLKREMRGWRVGLVTSDSGLANATGLPFLPAGSPVAHGGLKVTLWRTDPL